MIDDENAREIAHHIRTAHGFLDSPPADFPYSDRPEYFTGLAFVLVEKLVPLLSDIGLGQLGEVVAVELIERLASQSQPTPTKEQS